MAWGQGVVSYRAYTILKVDGSSRQPVSNVTLNSSYSIVNIVGNSSHIFAHVVTDALNALAVTVMTFEADTLKLVGEVNVNGVVMLSGVNAAGTLFVVVTQQSWLGVLVVNASTGVLVAALDGGIRMSVTAATYDATTDSIIAYDSLNYNFIYGLSLNNTVLWNITTPSDLVSVPILAVDPRGRSLYAFMEVATATMWHLGGRLIQYDLNTHEEVGRYDVDNSTVVPIWQLAAGPVDGEVYVANSMDGTVTRLSVHNGVEQVTSFSRYPVKRTLSSVASLDGKTFTVFTVVPFQLLTISAEGVVQRRTLIAPMDACTYDRTGPSNIDVDMHGNVFVPLCTLGVRVYSPDHTLLHVIHTPTNTMPHGVAVTPSGEFVYVIYSLMPQYLMPLTQLYEVATGNLVANFSSSDQLGPNAIAVDSADDSLWAITTSGLHHWAINTTLLDAFDVSLVAVQLAVDSQRRQLVVSVSNLDMGDQLDWLSMTDGALVQQFQYPIIHSSGYIVSGAGAVMITKDDAVTVAVELDDGEWYFFRNDNATTCATAGRQQQQVP